MDAGDVSVMNLPVRSLRRYLHWEIIVYYRVIQLVHVNAATQCCCFMSKMIIARMTGCLVFSVQLLQTVRTY